VGQEKENGVEFIFASGLWEATYTLVNNDKRKDQRRELVVRE
jgi:hypothetical protein